MKMKSSHSTQVSRWRKHATILLFALLAFSPALSAQKKEKLAKTYREWLEHDVVYIITKDERVRFLALPTDEAGTNSSRISGRSAILFQVRK